MPVKRLLLPYMRKITLGDLTAGDLVVVECWKCGRVYRVAPHYLIDRFQPGFLLDQLKEREFKCTRCGWGESLVHVMRATHPEPPPKEPQTAMEKIAHELGTTPSDLRTRRYRQGG